MCLHLQFLDLRCALISKLHCLVKHAEGHDAAIGQWQDERIAPSELEPQDILCLKMFQRCGVAVRTDQPTTSQR